LISHDRLRQGAALNTASASNAYVSFKANIVEVKTGATTSHVRIDIDNGVIISAAVTDEAVAELNLKRR